MRIPAWSAPGAGLVFGAAVLSALLRRAAKSRATYAHMDSPWLSETFMDGTLGDLAVTLRALREFQDPRLAVRIIQPRTMSGSIIGFSVFLGTVLGEMPMAVEFTPVHREFPTEAWGIHAHVNHERVSRREHTIAATVVYLRDLRLRRIVSNFTQEDNSEHTRGFISG